MTATEDRLRELLQAATPLLQGVSPDVLETQRRKTQLPLIVAATVVLVAALAVILTVVTRTTHKNTDATSPARSSSPPAAATGHIEGTLLISPPFDQQYPVAGMILITGPHHLARAAGTDGRFSVTLPAGRYTLIGHTPRFIINGRQGDCIPQTNPTVVRADQTAHVTVICPEK